MNQGGNFVVEDYVDYSVIVAILSFKDLPTVDNCVY